MAGIKNKYDFYKGFLEALGAEGINETDYKNEEELRKKILDALDVEYVFDDVNQTDLFREKFLQGISSGGGGGSSDFTVATVLLHASGFGSLPIINVSNTGMHSSALFNETHLNAVLYRGEQVIGTSNISGTITVSDNAVYDSENNLITVTGDCTITIA